MKRETAPLIIFTIGLLLMIAVTIVITYRKREESSGEGCMSIVVLSILWAAFCGVLNILIQTITN